MSRRTDGDFPFRLGRKLALLSMTIGLAMASTLGGLATWLDYRAEMTRNGEQLAEITRASLPALQAALWLGDAELVGSYLDGLMQFRDMARVELHWEDNFKPPLFRGVAPPAEVATIIRTIPINREFKGRDTRLGTLTLTFSLERIQGELHDGFWRVLLSQILQMSALAALILLAFQRLGGRRLQQMCDDTIRYRGGDTAARMSPAHRPTVDAWDELDQLAVEFNSLLDSQERFMNDLRTANSSLNQEVIERQRAELALRQARDAAETANRAKSTFLANMSHELRTPLNAILGFAQLMARDRRQPADQLHNLETINRSGQHLLALINDVLEISRIEASRLSVQTQSVELLSLIQPLTEAMALRAGDKGLALRQELASDLPQYIETDVLKLRQILLNLLSNAVKYTQHGSITLSVEVLPEPESQPSGEASGPILLRFAVRDTGVGIAPSDVERLFQPFFQTPYGTQLGEGTGLGLTISYEYARLLGGELKVSSVLGTGSTFALTLPVRRLAADAASTMEPTAGRVARLAADQPAYRILVAEDNADSRRLLVDLLAQVGFEVSPVCDGVQAVAAVAAWQPDLVWLDMRMPVMDGYEAARRIRALPNGDRVKIAALTASAFREEQEAILAAGCNEVLSKPVDVNRLFAITAKLLGARFEYLDAPANSVPAPAGLEALAPEVRQRLAKSARELDMVAVRSIIDELRQQAPAEATLLNRLLDAFRLDLIADMAELRQEAGVVPGCSEAAIEG